MTKWTPEEQREHRRLWVAALRSDKYPQGREVLHDGVANQFCCLGVACDISGLGEWKTTSSTALKYLDNEKILPPQVRDWLGLHGTMGSHQADDMETTSLADLNDLGMPFAEIADIIENEPARLIKGGAP